MDVKCNAVQCSAVQWIDESAVQCSAVDWIDESAVQCGAVGIIDGRVSSAFVFSIE